MGARVWNACPVTEGSSHQDGAWGGHPGLRRDPNADQRLRSSCQWLASHARLRAHSIAIADGVTYHALALNVLRIGDALTLAGIQSGHVLGVETLDRYLHLLLLLAAESLSVTTISLVRNDLEPPIPLGTICDRVVVSEPVAAFDPARTVVMTYEWVVQALSRSVAERRLDELERPPRGDAAVRFARSSGTTGVPKIMGLTHRMLRRMIQKNLLEMSGGAARNPDFLCLYNFTVRAAYWRTMLTLQAGGTVHFIGKDNMWEKISGGHGNYLWLVSGDLARLAETAPAERGPFDLRIEVTGGAIASAVRAHVRRNIASDLAVTYSANEVQRISLIDDDDVGTLFPEVSVEIVDDSGQALPPGRRGLIRVRTDTMIEGYVGAPDLTRAALADGWYRTGDIGFQPAADKLVVLGRADDMVNAGGVKIAPGPIEQRLKAIDGVRDAVVTSAGESSETGELLVVVETTRDADAPRAAIADVVGQYAHKCRLVFLPAFPRTETGKIQREELRKLCRGDDNDLAL